jgi:hypothetical protein
VQQQHGHPLGRRLPQQPERQRRVDAAQVEVTIPEADVKLDRQPRVR